MTKLMTDTGTSLRIDNKDIGVADGFWNQQSRNKPQLVAIKALDNIFKCQDALISPQIRTWTPKKQDRKIIFET